MKGSRSILWKKNHKEIYRIILHGLEIVYNNMQFVHTNIFLNYENPVLYANKPLREVEIAFRASWCPFSGTNKKGCTGNRTHDSVFVAANSAISLLLCMNWNCLWHFTFQIYCLLLDASVQRKNWKAGLQSFYVCPSSICCMHFFPDQILNKCSSWNSVNHLIFYLLVIARSGFPIPDYQVPKKNFPVCEISNPDREIDLFQALALKVLTHILKGCSCITSYLWMVI